MHRGWQCTGPNELLDARLGDALKGALPGLGGGVHAFFVLFLVCSVWGNALHGYKIGGNAA